MDKAYVVSRDCLKTASYRWLQKTAKSMGLPANVQRVFLIQLIQTKTCKTSEELELLIQHVKEQRALATTFKKMKNQRGRVQGSEISSTSSVTSPIRRAPKRHSQLLFRYSPEAQLIRYKTPKAKVDVSKPQTSTVTNKTIMPSKCGMKVVTYHPSPRKRCIVSLPNVSRNESFNNTFTRNRRILRSNNIRRQSVIVTEIDPDESNNYSAINIVSYDGKRKRNMTAYVRKRGIINNENAIAAIENNPERARQLVQVPRKSTPKRSRKRTISGISPLNVAENSLNSNDNAVSTTVCSNNNENMSNMSPIYENLSEELEIFNSEVDSCTEYIFSDSELSSRFPNITFELSQNDRQLKAEQEDLPDHGIYYHRNVRSSLMRSQTVTPVTNTLTLPKIVDVFTKFHQTDTDVTRPIHLDVNDAGTVQAFNEYTSAITLRNTSASLANTSGTIANISASLANTTLLETLYNFKKSFIVMNDLNPPIPSFTVCKTKLVYNTKTVVTPFVQPPAKIITTECFVAPFSRDEIQQFNPVESDLPQGYNFSQYTTENASQQNHTYPEVVSVSQNSPVPGCLEETGANVTIPEMVEDAMEIISQDGDYMVRIKMDAAIRCVLCNWVGPLNMVEFHVRQEHSDDILHKEANEWNITYTLASLVRGQWISKIIEYECILYVLSAKYEDPNQLMVSLNVLVFEEYELLYKGKITIYNKVTGEPIVWQGNIVRLPETLSSSFGENIMIIPLSKLNVLPNCTNLTLGKVVGQPDLNDIHIIFFIELYE